ncbi:MAG: hypothetical protein ACJ79K_07875 [Gemmatimonadaceae bacterium]
MFVPPVAAAHALLALTCIANPLEFWMRSISPLLGALTLALVTSSAHAQAAVDTAAAGSATTSAELASASPRVRLKMSRETIRTDGHYMIEGTLLDANGTRAIVQRPDRAAPDTVPMFTVDHIERYAGQNSRGKMVLAGAGGGAALSLIARGMANLTNGGRCQTQCDSPLIPGYLYAVPVVLGAFIGSVFPSTHWVEVKRPEVSVGVTDHHQLQLSSSIDFR